MTHDQRIDILKNILMDLHHGAEPASVQDQFNQHFKGVSAIEISLMEHQLMNSDTGITFEDVMKLCNVHANLFKNAIQPSEVAQIELPGHPVRIFKDENLALQAALIRIRRILDALGSAEGNLEPGLIQGLWNQVDLLGQFDKHYTRKEKLFFPHMEMKGHVAPPKVMWGVDDEIREQFDHFKTLVHTLPEGNLAVIIAAFDAFDHEFKEMIFKEESILLNILLELLTEDEWYQIAQEQDAYGYCLISKPEVWIPERKDFGALHLQKEPDHTAVTTSNSTEKLPLHRQTKEQWVQIPGGKIKWEFVADEEGLGAELNKNRPIYFEKAGVLSLEQIELILNHLPLEVTFVSEENIFQYFNQVEAYENMLFPRTPSQIGRNLELCHPPKVWDKVKELMEDLRTGKRDKETMWFKTPRQYIYVTYQALRTPEGEFRGVLETVQDIQPFLDIEQDQKRNLSDIPQAD